MKKFKTSKFFKIKKKKNFKKGLGTKGVGLVLLRPLSKKKKKIHQSIFFQIPSKIQDFQFLRKIQVFEIQKKIFIKFFFRNRKL